MNQANPMARTADPSDLNQLRIERAGDGQRLTARQWVARPIDEVFDFFSQASNLQRLTPDFIGFEILTPQPIDMQVGTLIDYRIRVRGLSMRWRTRIAAWEPGVRFVDEQLKGPYRKWVHEHRFEPVDGGTLCHDTVDYRVPGWVLSPLVNRWMVEPDVRKIFAFRIARLAELFPSDSGPASDTGDTNDDERRSATSQAVSNTDT